MRMHLPISVCLMAITAAGCGWKDPSRTGETAPRAATKWIPHTPIPRQPRCDDPIVGFPPEDNHPLGISELLDIALRNNPLTRETWNIARAAAFTVKINESALYPTVNLTETLDFTKIHPAFGSTSISSETTFSSISLPGGSALTPQSNAPPISSAPLPTYTRSINHNLTVTYLVMDTGGRAANIEAARQALIAANWTHNRNLQTVMLNVLNGYYSYASNKALLEARLQDLKDTKTNLDAAEAQFQAGVQTIIDVLQSRSSYSNAQVAVENATGLTKIAMGQLARALGLPANTEFAVQPLPENLATEQISRDLQLLIDTAKAERPDLAAAYSNYMGAKQQIIVSNSAGNPTLVAVANAQSTVFFHQSALNNQFYNGSLFLSIPIFSGFLYRNEVLNAKANTAAAYDAYRNLEETVMLDVVASYYSFTTAVQTVRSSEEYLKYSQEAYNASFENYKAGTGSILDLVVVQGVLSNARAQAIEAKTQLVTSIAALAYAMGTL